MSDFPIDYEDALNQLDAAQSRIKELEAENKKLKGRTSMNCPECGEYLIKAGDAHWLDKLAALKAQLKEAREVIGFYANRDNYDRDGVCEHNGARTDYKGDWWVDYGFTAREFLEKYGKDGEG